MDTLLQDLWRVARTLAKSPRSSAVALATLALGIGLSSSMFSVVDAVLWKPLPYSNADRLMALWEYNPERDSSRMPASPANFVDWRAEAKSFDVVAGYFSWFFNVTGGEFPERASSALVTADFFPLLGVPAALGRTLDADDADQEGSRVVLSHSFWQRRLGGDPGAVGTTVTLDGTASTIVGVMPEAFRFPDGETDLWMFYQVPADERDNRGGKYLRALGRLEDGVTAEQAQAEMDVIAQRLAETYPDTNRGWGVNVVALREDTVGRVRTAMLALLGSVVLVLLIACANLAHLQLARGIARGREMAVRGVLGASPLRIARLLLIESFLLALAGSVLGLLLAFWAVDVLLYLSPENLPRLEEVHVDWRVALFGIGMALSSGLLSGLIPALRGARSDLSDSLRVSGATARHGARSRRFRALLVTAEVALTLALLVGTGLLSRSLVAVMEVNPGFSSEKALTFRFFLARGKYTNEQQISFFQELESRLAALAEVRSVGLINDLPLQRNRMMYPVRFKEHPETPSGEEPFAAFRAVNPSYFSSMDVPVLRGRTISAADRQEAVPVAVVNATMARSFWPDQDPIGRRFAFEQKNGEHLFREIVGVAGDVKHMGLDKTEGPAFYVPLAQETFAWLHWTTVVVRTTGEPRSMIGAVRSQVLAMDPNQPIFDVRTLDEMMLSSYGNFRFNAWVLGVFAAAALFLAAVGLYGVLSQWVGERLPEIGIRLALGARRADIVRLVVGRGLSLTLTGLIAGLAVAALLGRFLGSLLFEVSSADVLSYLSPLLLFVTVAIVACYLPARHSSRVDPMTVLRSD